MSVPSMATARLMETSAHGLDVTDALHRPPLEPFHVELPAPDGPEDAAQRVTGSALDFCLRVTRRRHRAADLAQAFAGPSGVDRAPAGAA